MNMKVLEKLEQPPFPEPVSTVDIRPYWDFDQEESLWVTVNLKAGTDIDAMTGDQISSIKELIWERIKNEGITLFPYFGIHIDGEDSTDDDEDNENT
ncbi:hypothetical protein [Lacunimicrobium album]